jgi:hypothetical protein
MIQSNLCLILENKLIFSPSFECSSNKSFRKFAEELITGFEDVKSPEAFQEYLVSLHERYATDKKRETHQLTHKGNLNFYKGDLARYPHASFNIFFKNVTDEPFVFHEARWGLPSRLLPGEVALFGFGERVF